MKETRTKLLSLLVVLCMVLTLLPMAALAADAQFKDMPNDYSTAALQAAVTNGLLKGSGGQLRPAASLTRAEMATILNHAFGAAEKSDISGYTDVPAGAWYANEMAVAVHMKALVGSGKKLNPSAPVTRQEALTALASILKMPAGSDTALAKYKDNAMVASWAKGSVAAMTAAGYAGGDGANLNPTANITRADFAVIMNSVVKTYITKAGTYTDNLTGNVMVNVPGVVLKNITITGDLIIGDGVGSGDITLDGVTVTGRTVVRGGGVHSIKIINKSNVGTLTISKVDGEVRVAADASSSVEVVVINDGKDDVIVEGNVDKLEVAAGVPVTVQGGTVGEVSVTAPHASVTVASTATVTTLTATGAQPTLTVQGTVTTLTADKTATGATVTVAKGAKVGTVNAAAEGAAISGEGTVTNANVTGNNVNVATSGTSVTVAKDVTGAKSGDKDLKGGTTTTTTGTTTTPTGGGVVTAITVTTKEELQSVLANSQYSTIILGANISADVTIPSGKTLTLNLNGYTLTGVTTAAQKPNATSKGNTVAPFIQTTITNNGTLTIVDTSSGKTGTVAAAGQYTGALLNETGATATLIGGTFKDCGTTNDWYIVVNLGNMIINEGVTITNTDPANTSDTSLINGCDQQLFPGDDINGYAPATDAEMTINGGTFISGLFVVKNGDWYAQMTINGGTFEAKNSHVNGCTLSNANNCPMTVTGGTFTAVGDTPVVKCKDKSDYVGKGTGTGLNITGGMFTQMGAGDAIQTLTKDGTNAPAPILTISGGTFTGTLNAKIQDGTTVNTNRLTYILTTNYTIALGTALAISPNVTVVIPSGVTVTNNGTLTVTGSRLCVGGTLDNAGTIVVQNNGESVGCIEIGNNNDVGTVTNKSGGTITNNSNILLHNGTLTNNGTIGGTGYFLIFKEADLKAVAAYAPAGSRIVNFGKINIGTDISFNATLMGVAGSAITVKSGVAVTGVNGIVTSSSDATYYWDDTNPIWTTQFWNTTVGLNSGSATGSGTNLTASLTVSGDTVLQFSPTTTNPFTVALTSGAKIPFKLTNTGGVDLDAYYKATKTGANWSTGWAKYLISTLPNATDQTAMFYLAFDGTNYKLVDGTQDYVQSGDATDGMIIPANFPAGTYTLTGTVNGTAVTVALTVVNGNG